MGKDEVVFVTISNGAQQGGILLNFYCKMLHVSGRSSASAIFVENNITNFECLIRRDIYSFTTRLKSSLISAIENCWLLKFVIWKPVLIDKLFP